MPYFLATYQLALFLATYLLALLWEFLTLGAIFWNLLCESEVALQALDKDPDLFTDNAAVALEHAIVLFHRRQRGEVTESGCRL